MSAERHGGGASRIAAIIRKVTQLTAVQIVLFTG
jgi:hypothetical protein